MFGSKILVCCGTAVRDRLCIWDMIGFLSLFLSLVSLSLFCVLCSWRRGLYSGCFFQFCTYEGW